MAELSSTTGVVVMLILLMHVSVGQATDCQKLLQRIDGNVTFVYRSMADDHPRRFADILRLTKDQNVIVDHIIRIEGYTGTYLISSSYDGRISVYGYIKYIDIPPWNISITMTSVSSSDAGEYKLEGWGEDIPIGTFCLSILDRPVMLLETMMVNGTDRLVTVEGGNVIIPSRSANILGNTTDNSVSMSWLLDDKTLESGGSFLVYPEKLVILSVPASLHGTKLTYRATVNESDVMTETSVHLLVAHMAVHLSRSDKLIVVKAGDVLPDIVCEIKSTIKVEVEDYTWIHGDVIITDSTVLSLGEADITMSGEYRCIATLSVTGQRKENSVYIAVYEQAQQFSMAFIVLSIITGLTASSVIIVAVVFYMRNKSGRSGGNQNQSNDRPINDELSRNMATTSNMEAPSYIDLQLNTPDNRVYDQLDASSFRK